MPAKITHDVVATIGKYKDRQTGEEKKRHLTVGKCLTDEQGRQSIKLDAVPVGTEWSGWLSLYPVRDRDAGPPLPQGRRTSPGMPPAPDSRIEEADDIPF